MVAIVRYCTPEWLQASAEGYRSSPRLQQALAKLTLKVCFLIRADPAWGIDQDILFGSFIRQGELEKLDFFSAQDARDQAEFVLGATPQEWKKLLRRENKFITDFMLGKVTLEQGSKVGVLSVAPHSTTLVDIMTQAELQFPDEMSPEELAAYRSYVAAFRLEKGV
jgi:hypothetical protein